ncbi:tetratricopeptide repeat protein [Stagnimonas aquatica]|uniref:Tetratricopeptide repeat protein n=1 Tax=Stagnimonas aquatica TaxID=2689987 RepID=A0A3N0VGL2_9GAMM|nr:tetratricopeptide repeat protein [Stagnimonas aquatica]ROH91834.1 tetratricopeptide repeat protein [Stagnimonas aquatica]
MTASPAFLRPAATALFAGAVLALSSLSAQAGSANAVAQAAYDEASQLFERENYPAAVAAYDRALAADPAFKSALQDRGLAKLRGGDYAGAAADFSTLIARAKAPEETDEAYAYRGQARAGLKDYAGALADLGRAIELCPTCSYFYFNRGKVRLQMGAKTEAKADLTEAADRGVEEAMELLEGL